MKSKSSVFRKFYPKEFSVFVSDGTPTYKCSSSLRIKQKVKTKPVLARVIYYNYEIFDVLHNDSK